MTASASSNNLGTVLPNAGGSFAIAESEIQAAQIGTTVTKPVFLQYVAVTLTAAQVLAMYATPVQLIPAPATGSSIVVSDCMIRVTAGATQFASGGVVAPQYANTVHGGGTLITSTLAASVVNAATSADTQLGLVAAAADLTIPQATGVFLSNPTGAFTTGNGTLTVFLWYRVV